MTEINGLFADALRFDLLVIDGNEFHFAFEPKAGDLRAPVWKLILSAYDLLKEGNLPYIRQCQGCSWLFTDRTKNHRKKWCSMESCGNAHKTKRYYELHRSIGAPSPPAK